MKKIIKITFLSVVSIGILLYSTVLAITNGIEQEKNIKFLSNNYFTVFYENRMLGYDNEYVLLYSDNDNNTYFYKNNKLVGYINNSYEMDENMNVASIASEELSIKLEDYKELAIKYAKELMITNIENYTLSSATYLDATKEYSYVFSKYIDGYLVNDGIMVSIDEYGNIISYSGAYQGLFDNYQNIKIDKEDVERFIEKSMLDMACDTYTVDMEYINFQDNNLVLQIGIEIENNIGISTEVIYYPL